MEKSEENDYSCAYWGLRVKIPKRERVAKLVQSAV